MDLTLDEVKSLTDLDEIQKIFLQLRIEEVYTVVAHMLVTARKNYSMIHA